jgi:hypothetical protein
MPTLACAQAGEGSIAVAAPAAGSFALGHVPGRRHHREGGDDRPCGGFARNLDGLGRKSIELLGARAAVRRGFRMLAESATFAQDMKSSATAKTRWHVGATAI